MLFGYEGITGYEDAFGISMFMLILPRFASIGFVGVAFNVLCENEGVFTIDICAMFALGPVVAAGTGVVLIPAAM